MTVSQTDFALKVRERAQENQPQTRRRVNSRLSALFGSGLVATVAVGAIDLLPWWAVIVIAVILAVGETLAQAFSKTGFAPSQAEAIAEAAAQLEAEANPEPTATDLKLSQVQDTVETLNKRLDQLLENQALEAEAAAEAEAPDRDEELRTLYSTDT